MEEEGKGERRKKNAWIKLISSPMGYLQQANCAGLAELR